MFSSLLSRRPLTAFNMPITRMFMTTPRSKPGVMPLINPSRYAGAIKQQSLLQLVPSRSCFFMLQQSRMGLRPFSMVSSSTNQLSLVETPQRGILKTNKRRKSKPAFPQEKKYKLKTKKAAQKRFRVVSKHG